MNIIQVVGNEKLNECVKNSSVLWGTLKLSSKTII